MTKFYDTRKKSGGGLTRHLTNLENAGKRFRCSRFNNTINRVKDTCSDEMRAIISEYLLVDNNVIEINKMLESKGKQITITNKTN